MLSLAFIFYRNLHRCFISHCYVLAHQILEYEAKTGSRKVETKHKLTEFNMPAYRIPQLYRFGSLEFEMSEHFYIQYCYWNSRLSLGYLVAFSVS
jgi:hypothetical protein